MSEGEHRTCSTKGRRTEALPKYDFWIPAAEGDWAQASKVSSVPMARLKVTEVVVVPLERLWARYGR